MSADIGVVLPGDPSATAPEPPKLADRVWYTLTEGDAWAINRRREDYTAFQRGMVTQADRTAYTGHIAHVGNRAAEGDVCAAEVVRVFPNAGTAANLQVKLDGNDTFWATSRCRGDGPGFWRPVAL